MLAMTSFWKWIDGKKTTVGATIYFAGKGISVVNPAVGEIVSQIGEFICGVGLLHKGQKTYTKKTNGTD